MEGRALLQYLIDTSDVLLAKKQEATEYLAKLEEATQHSALPTGLNVREIEIICPNCNLVFDVPVPEPHSG